MENEIKKVSLLEKASGGLMKAGSFMGQQRHFSAIRDAFGAFLPLLIVGAIAVMINSVFIQAGGLLGTLCGTDENLALYDSWNSVAAYISPLFDGINNATMNLFALYIAFLLGYFLMGSYGGNELMGGLVGLATFMLLDPMLISVGGGANTGYLGAKGIIFAFATGLTAPMLLFKLQNVRSLQINMPEGVPPVVGNSLNSLFPFVITLLAFGAIQPIWGAIMMGAGVGSSLIDGIAGNNLVSINNTIYDVYFITNAFYAIIVVPFMNLAQSPFAVFLILFLVGLFWFFGVHGNNVMNPVVNALWTPAIVANVATLNAFGGNIDAAIASGELFIWTEQTMNCFALMGGASSVLALLVGISIFSKLPAQRAIASVATPIACFNISEPTMFGLPIVLSPTYFLPFIFVGSIQGLVAYYFTLWGFVNPTVVLAPWTTPLLLSGIMATLDWRSIFLTAINFAIAFFIYVPFVLFDIKAQTKLQAEAAGMELEDFKVMAFAQLKEEKVERKSSKEVNKLKFKIEILEKDESYVQAKLEALDSKLGAKLYSIEQSKGFAEHNMKVYENLGKPENAAKEKAKLDKVDSRIKSVTEKIETKKAKISSKVESIENEIKQIQSEIPAAQERANKKIEAEKAKNSGNKK